MGKAQQTATTIPITTGSVIKQAHSQLDVSSPEQLELMLRLYAVICCFLAILSRVFCITCYECTSSQGQDCKYSATSCRYGLFGCVKIAAYSGGVDRMGNWYNQDRSIISMFRGCAILPFGGADICEQSSIFGVRILRCTCYNDYCNSSRSVHLLKLALAIIYVFLY